MRSNLANFIIRINLQQYSTNISNNLKLQLKIDTNFIINIMKIINIILLIMHAITPEYSNLVIIFVIK